MPIAPKLAETLLVDLARFEIAAFEHAALDRTREEATEEALRVALALRAAADRLGVTLDEDEDDWRALAIEATKVLIDVSRERGRRDGGLHDAPTQAFRVAIEAEGTIERPAVAGAAPDLRASGLEAPPATHAPLAAGPLAGSPPISPTPAPARRGSGNRQGSSPGKRSSRAPEPARPTGKADVVTPNRMFCL